MKNVDRPDCIYCRKPMHIHGYSKKDARKTWKCGTCNFTVREGTLRATKINHLLNWRGIIGKDISQHV
jgi:ribosomal protein L37AE/L43A